MLRTVDLRNNLTEKKEQESKDDSHKQELYQEAVAKVHDLQEEVIQQCNNGYVNQVVTDEDGSQQALAVLPEAKYLGVGGMTLLLDFAEVGRRQAEKGYLAG